LIASEREYLESLASESAATVATQAGLTYLTYLQSNWMTESLWYDWSQAGRIRASLRLNIPLDQIVTTTNHLEAFNGVLKHKYIRRFQKGGHRLRFDLLIFLMVKQILPGIFLRRTLEFKYYEWLSARFKTQAGGHDLVAAKRTSTSSSGQNNDAQEHKFAWWVMEMEIDFQDEVTYMIKNNRIGPYNWANTYTITTTCASSLVDIRQPNHTRYRLFLNCYGWSSCECQAFRLSGTACKHLWAFRQILPQLNAPYGFIFPTTEIAARKIFLMLFPNTEITNPSTSTPTSVESLPPSLQSMVKDIGPSAIELIDALTVEHDSDESDDDDSTDMSHGEVNRTGNDMQITSV
jgi:hypothetical protein